MVHNMCVREYIHNMYGIYSDSAVTCGHMYVPWISALVARPSTLAGGWDQGTVTGPRSPNVSLWCPATSRDDKC